MHVVLVERGQQGKMGSVARQKLGIAVVEGGRRKRTFLGIKRGGSGKGWKRGARERGDCAARILEVGNAEGWLNLVR